MLRSSYCFVGLPFSGKSYIGKCLAINKNKGFIDTDNILKYQYNTELKNIIESIGVNKFTHFENNILKTLYFENTIISPGGSAIYCDEGINHLKNTLDCEIIHLYLSFEEFNKRAIDLNERGIINPGNLKIKDLYNERINLCNYYSDITLNADKKKNVYKELLHILD